MKKKWLILFVGLFLFLQSAAQVVDPDDLDEKEIITDKRDDTFFVLPGTVFCTYRTFSGEDLTLSPLFSEDLELVSIDLVSHSIDFYEREVPVMDVCEDVYDSITEDGEDECGKNASCAFVNESCVCEMTYTYSCQKGTEKIVEEREAVSYVDIMDGVFDDPETDKEEEISGVISLLPKSARALTSVGVAQSDSGGEVRFCFRAPTFEEILAGKKSSGRISYLAYDPDGYDVCTSSWWNADWDRRMKVTISGHKEDLSNYPVEVLFNATKLYDEGHLNDNCSDIAFANDTTSFDYWVKNCTTDDDEVLTSVWVNVTDLEGNVSRTDIYLYYNNSDYPSNLSNASRVFSFFDDFNDGVIGPMWTMSGTVNEGSGYVSTPDNGNNPHIWLNMGSRGLDYSTQFKASFRVYNAEDNGGGERGGWALSSIEPSVGSNAMRGGNYQLFYVNDANNQPFEGYSAFNQSEGMGNMNTNPGVWLEASFTRNISGHITWRLNNEIRVRNTPSGWTGGYFTFGEWDSDQTADESLMDDLIIRKYASPEPSSSLGSEETYSCSIGMACTSCSDWTYINLTGGGSLQVKDLDGDDKYDVVCCSGTVSGYTIL